MSKKHSTNDNRSNIKNPNNAAYEADRQNRINLGHENVPPPAPIQQPAPTPPTPVKK